MFAIAGIVFVGVMAAVLVISWKFREKDSDDPDEFPEQVHGRTVLEIGWTILPALILAGVAVGTVITILELNKEPEDAIQVEVNGQQWWWQYKYDINDDGNFDGPEDITTATELVIPAGREIALTTTSNDVIHSFWIPGLNGKKDAVPGIDQPTGTSQADEPRHLPRPVHRVLRPLPRQHAHARPGPAHRRVRPLGRATSSRTTPLSPPAPTPQEGRKVWESLCAQCHVINGHQRRQARRQSAAAAGVGRGA